MFGPNIQGTTNVAGYAPDNWTVGGSATGPFQSMVKWGSGLSAIPNDTHGAVISINANLDNALYNGQSLRLPALQTLPCIRY